MKYVLIAALTLVVTLMHLFSGGSSLGFHLLHQQLFLVPLLLTSFWYGLRAGLLVTTVISLVYAPLMLAHSHDPGTRLAVLAQIVFFLVVAALIGWLSDRQRQQQRELAKNERTNALAMAASNMSLEVKTIADQITRAYNQAGGLADKRLGEEFGTGLTRLNSLVETLGHFAPSLENLAAASDLNEIITHHLKKYRGEATRLGVKIVVSQGEASCPFVGEVGILARVFDALVSNALEFSKKGGVVTLRSASTEDSYLLEVADTGEGVAKDNENDLFTAFFTTRDDGYGLSLSSGRKSLRELGGDLTYRANQPTGAIFTMRIPRKSIDESLLAVSERVADTAHYGKEEQ